MDMGQLLISVLGPLWWLLLLALLAALARTPVGKGMLGEWLVNLMARLRLERSSYRLIRNVTLPTEDGTTQIDHIIVSRYGIFVVETKNMQGWIFGGPKQKTWTQKVYKSSHRFQNPLHQNYKHTRTLRALLGLDADKLFSVVVFVGDSTFKTPMPDNVTYAGGYIAYIRSKTEIVLSEEEVARAIALIESERLAPSIKTHLQHARHVRGIVEAKTARPPSAPSQPADRLCPACGSVMLLRIAEKGEQAGKPFWGCSQFPHCLTIAEVDTP